MADYIAGPAEPDTIAYTVMHGTLRPTTIKVLGALAAQDAEQMGLPGMESGAAKWSAHTSTEATVAGLLTLIGYVSYDRGTAEHRLHITPNGWAAWKRASKTARRQQRRPLRGRR